MDFTDVKISNMSAALKKVNRRKALFTVAAILVAFLTFYALVLPALTWERSLICSKPEHTHTDKCYEEVFVDEAKVLICENEEAGHEHTDACYEIVPAHTDKQLVCGMEEHVHDDSCFDAPPSEDEGYTCGMVEHTHNELCYNSDGTLRCTIPEHQHTDDCKPEVKSTEKPVLKALGAPLGASGGSGTAEQIYWIPVTSYDDLNGNDIFMIVTKEEGVALSGANQTTSVKADMQAVSGKPGYYTSNLDDEYWWKLYETGLMQNVGEGQYVRLNNNSDILASSKSNGTMNTINNNSANGWNVYMTSRSSNYGYYLDYSYGSFNSAYTRYSDGAPTYYYIYKQVIEEGPAPTATTTPTAGPTSTPTTTPTAKPTAKPTPTPGGGSVITKPNYPADKAVSDGKTGDTSLDGVPGTYWSDPATSQLESKFNGSASDDGKVLVDKSVVYGNDDYGAYKNTPDNTFTVALSALAQTYELTANVQGPIDVVFVVDTSGSMIDTVTSNGSNAATENAKALNKAMKMVMDANPDNRAGVVCFSNYSHKILELGRYTATNDKFFPESGYNSSTSTFAPSSSIKRTDGTLYKGSSNQWYGTYTQAGIAEGAKELIDATDKQVEVLVDFDAGDGRTVQKTVTMTRRPVIILLSDGEPTFCNEKYNAVLENNSSIHGTGSDGYLRDSDGQYRPVHNWGNYRSGSYDYERSYDGAYPPNYSASFYRTNNPKGVMGYYTILTADS